MKNKILQFWTKLFLLSCFFVLSTSATQAQQLAFPGAEGFGRYTTGGRGGAVFEVTNLNDAGAGSLRDACSKTGPRTIVFRVSGTITLLSDLKITQGNLTIAGQTAPGDGICVRDYQFVIEASNIIIRYMRFRVGNAKVATTEPDAIHMNGDPGGSWSNVIIDHCSMSWSVDETASFYDNRNLTLQWCIISESLYNAGHVKGAHGYGGIQGGMNASFHHNLYADHTSRNPRFNGARWHQTTYQQEIVDFRNNVIFNWGFQSVYGGEWGQQNMVNNYYKPGPATKSGVKNRIVEISHGILDNSTSPPTDSRDPGKWYITGNYMDGNSAVTADNWANPGTSGLGGVQGSDGGVSTVRSLTEFGNASSTIVTELATDAYTSVLNNAGANFPTRDAIDTRIISEVQSGTCAYGGSYSNNGITANTGIIDSAATVGGWPTLNSTTAPTDTDQDGMPDSWETAHGYIPTYAGDRNAVGSDGYTALEKYLNCLVGGTCPPASTYTLTATTDGTGSVTMYPAGGTYAEGTVVTLTPNPGVDSVFQNWTGDVTGTTNPINVTVSANKSVTAHFQSAIGMKFQLTTSVVGPGDVTFSPDTTAAGYDYNTVVTVTAVPTSGNSFVNWSGDLSGTTASTTITINGNKNINAKFLSATAKKVAYVTDPSSGFYANDTQILPALKADSRFIVTEIIVSNVPTTDFTPYDVVVLSEVPGSTVAGISALKGINKPFLMMKCHSYKTLAGAWNWTTSTTAYGQDPSETNIVVSDMTNPIFDGVTFVNTNEVKMLSSVIGSKGLTFMNPAAFTSVSDGVITSIAAVKNAPSEVSILEIPSGTTVSSTLVPQCYMQIGINSTSYANVTSDGVLIVLNACYYLANCPLVATGIHAPAARQLSDIVSYPTMVNDIITIDLSESKAGNASVNILSLTGQNVFSKEISGGKKTDLNLGELVPGLYFCQIQNAEGVATKKIIKK